MTAAAGSSYSATDETLLLSALRDAARVLYDSRRRALAVIAILDKVNFGDAMGQRVDSNDYDLVFGVESLLAQLRDEAEDEFGKIDSLVRRAEETQGGTQ